MPSSGIDKAALCEKILKDLDATMKNKLLLSFEVVPVEVNTSNTSPVLQQQNCFAIESWCVKYVYMHCYTELMDKYVTNKKKRSSKINSMNQDAVRVLLNGALLLNPDTNTFWNVRRDMLNKGLLMHEDELHFSMLVLSWKPKSNEAFAYRKWLVDWILAGEGSTTANTFDFRIRTELQVALMCALKCPTNYHAWSHRIWFTRKLRDIVGQSADLYYIREYIFSKNWTSEHVSDCSGFSYRQHCISNIFKLDNEVYRYNVHNVFDFSFYLDKLLKKDPSFHAPTLSSLSDKDLMTTLLGKFDGNYLNIAEFLRIIHLCVYELELNEDMMSYFKYYETLWNHRRFVIQTMVQAIMAYFGMRDSIQRMDSQSYEDLKKQQSFDDMHSSCLLRAIKGNESDIVNVNRKDDIYAVKYEKWLKFVLRFIF